MIYLRQFTTFQLLGIQEAC
ncbi:MAG: hypothetical protein ACFB2X_00240 [Rivularia sp. (in: cyanobacteria)]